MNELDKLRKMLDDTNIPYESFVELVEDKKWMDAKYKKHLLERYGEAGKYLRNQIIYGRYGKLNDWKLDGICQQGSYGAKDGLIETYGDLGVGSYGDPMVLTAQEVFEIIKNDYKNT